MAKREKRNRRKTSSPDSYTCSNRPDKAQTESHTDDINVKTKHPDIPDLRG